MSVPEAIREQVMRQAQGALALQVAFIGVSRDLFRALERGPVDAVGLAARTGLDAGYLARWLDAAYAVELVDADGDAFRLAELGRAYLPDVPGTLMPMAAGAALTAHMAERAATLMGTGERPGERVLAERPALLPLFGPMLELSFGPMLAAQVLPAAPEIGAALAGGGLAVDLGCGNGWYLRKLLAAHAGARGLGLDGFEENVRQARVAAEAAGLGGRARFEARDLHDVLAEDEPFGGEPVALLAMNRALHHVWPVADRIFALARRVLAPDGVVAVWEPRWPDERAALRVPPNRPLAFQNLAEHVQGNHFLRPAEVEAAMRAAGLAPRTALVADGREMVVIGRR